MSVPIDASAPTRSGTVMMCFQKDGKFGKFVRLCGNCSPQMIRNASRPVENMGYAERDAVCMACGASQAR